MQFGYGYVRRKLSAVPKQLTVALGLLALPITMRFEKVNAATRPPKQPPPAKPVQPLPNPDPRTLRLKKFFAGLHCPVLDLSEEFVHAADDNHLDWRLLPSISVVESGGGKAYRNNNIFGWNNGQQLFPSIRSGINQVAYKLGKSPLYQNQDLVGKLRLYNPDESYVHTVLTVMNRISPVVNLRPARRVIRQQNQFVYATD